MVACRLFSCTTTTAPLLHPLSTARRRRIRRSIRPPCAKFDSQEALTFLQNSTTTFTHLKLIHAKILRHPTLSFDHLLLRNLLHLCFSFAQIDYATRLFHHHLSYHPPPTFTWNFMIRSYTHHGHSHQALLLYNLMISRGFPPPDKFTFPFVLKACSAIRKAQEVHALAIKSGFYKDSFLHTTLMDVYFKCKDPISGCKVFDKMFARNVVSWTALVAGLVACDELDAARKAFDEMPVRNVVSWTAMICGYVNKELPDEAFELFWRMQLEGVRPNDFTLVSLLKASAQLGSLKLGTWIHDYALRNGFELSVFIGTALIDMYSKCSSLENAKQVFGNMQVKSLATWNAMITSLGVHGYGEEALAFFAQMEEANIKPDAITFVGVLCACVINNNLQDGERYFNYMKEHYAITPILDHYTCMIELYRRFDMSHEINRLVNTMPMNMRDSLAEALILPRTIDGNRNVEKSLVYNGTRLPDLGTITGHWSKQQLQCIGWDAG